MPLEIRQARDHVYIVFVNSLDHVSLGCVSGLRDAVVHAGYRKIFYGQSCHECWLRERVRQINAEDPDARIVLVGYSLGCHTAYAIAERVLREGVLIHLLVYTSGNTLIALPPPLINVERVLDLRGGCPHEQEAGDTSAEACGRLACFAGPTNERVVSTLLEHLERLASTVPLAPPPAPAPGNLETLPAPKAVPDLKGGKGRTGWDLLLPSSRLQEPPSLTPLPAPRPVSETVPAKGGP
jgi:hypothetical protein